MNAAGCSTRRRDPRIDYTGIRLKEFHRAIADMGPPGIWWLLVVRTDEQDRAGGGLDDLLSDAAKEYLSNRTPAMSADHDQVGIPAARFVGDGFANRAAGIDLQGHRLDIDALFARSRLRFSQDDLGNVVPVFLEDLDIIGAKQIGHDVLSDAGNADRSTMPGQPQGLGQTSCRRRATVGTNKYALIHRAFPLPVLHQIPVG